jgi:hypothetical protein
MIAFTPLSCMKNIQKPEKSWVGGSQMLGRGPSMWVSHVGQNSNGHFGYSAGSQTQCHLSIMLSPGFQVLREIKKVAFVFFVNCFLFPLSQHASVVTVVDIDVTTRLLLKRC